VPLVVSFRSEAELWDVEGSCAKLWSKRCERACRSKGSMRKRRATGRARGVLCLNLKMNSGVGRGLQELCSLGPCRPAGRAQPSVTSNGAIKGPTGATCALAVRVAR